MDRPAERHFHCEGDDGGARGHRPDNAEAYQANSADYVKQLEALDHVILGRV
jgi:hypothetical protein